MSLFHDNAIAGASGNQATGYKIERSLRFNSSDSAYLSRTPASAGNRKTWTWSGWVKRSALTVNNYFFGCETATTQSGSLYFSFDAGAFNVLSFGFFWRTTTAVFRDPSAWFHLVVAVDTTESTANNRIRIYFNGVEQTAFSTLNNPTQNADLGINQAAAHVIGDYKLAGNLFYSGYLADIHFIDGQALTPSSFAETNITTGQWVPKAYTGTYGTNGFRLAFADNSNNTATTLGKDSSPNGNNWTPNNLSVTAGAGNDSLVDTPTSYGTDTGAGGEVRGNYCTLNLLTSSAAFTLTNGSLDVSGNTSSAPVLLGTIGVNSGKWYWEVTLGNAYAYVGIAQVTSRSSVAYLGAVAGQLMYNPNNPGASWLNGVSYGYSTASTATTNDVIGVALNFDTNVITFYKNGVSQGTFGSNVLGTLTWAPAFKSNVATSAVFNFGQRPFAYTAPSGFKALCDTNLPAPVVAKPNTAFDVVLWTGNGTAQTISGLSFSPDLVWHKGRSFNSNQNFVDTVRGSDKYVFSNSTASEATNATALTSFTSDGFTVGTDIFSNQNGQTFVGWCFDAGSSTVTNTQGSITSQVRANASAGFSIVTYTGTGSAGSTVGHGGLVGLDKGMIIIKRRNSAVNWYIGHTSMGWTNSIFFTTIATFASIGVFNNTAPSSTVFTLGSEGDVNGLAGTFVAYCFAPVAGYSSFGSYTGNGSADGPFVFLGFRPAVVIVKMSSSTGNWTILDYQREGYNVDNDPLFPNLSDAEGTADLIDLTSNGFKVRTTDATFNTNAGTYIYAAWAQNPFQYARAR